MFIIDLIKKLMGKAQENVAKSAPGITGAITMVSQTLDSTVNAASKTVQDLTAEQPQKPVAEKQSYPSKITIGDKMYKVGHGFFSDGNDVLSESTDGGKNWRAMQAVPLAKVAGLKDPGDGSGPVVMGQLMQKGSTLGLAKSLYKSYMDPGDELKELEVAKAWEGTKGWGGEVMPYRFDEKGILCVASDAAKPNDFRPLIPLTTSMVLAKDYYTDSIKKELKAIGKDKDEAATIQIRCYAHDMKTLYFSVDGFRWLILEGALPDGMVEFDNHQGITVAIDKDDKKYFYLKGSWRTLDFEGDQEISDLDAEKAYKRLKVKETVYDFYDANDVNVCGEKTKTAHLWISAPKEEGSTICYICDNYLREDEFRGSFYSLTDVENFHEEVTLVCKDKKETTRYVFIEGKWLETGGDEDYLADDFRPGHGPFCFEATILDDDPFWDKVDSPITEYPLDARGKEVAKTRKIAIKFPRGSWTEIFYLDKDGTWKQHSRGLPGCPLGTTTIVCTGKPVPVTNKKGEILHYTLKGMMYYTFQSDTFACWMGKKKGFFKKEIVYDWVEVNPTDLEMMGKVNSKG